MELKRWNKSNGVVGSGGKQFEIQTFIFKIFSRYLPACIY